MATEKKITETLSRSVCGGWDRSFLESILDQIQRGRALRPNQKQTLGKVLARNNEESQRSHDGWKTEYAEKYKQKALVLANYHAQQPYYKPMAADILGNRVPERNKFLRMYNNKYSQKVLAAFEAAPRFEVNTHVIPRAGFNAYRDMEMGALAWPTKSSVVEKFKKHGGFIMSIEPEIYSHARGAKRYKILPVGATIPVIIEERSLKLHRKKK